MNQYPHKESAILEFKRDMPQKKQTMLKTVVGFANTYGGQIVVGIDDSGEIIGVPEDAIDQLIDDLNRSIYDSLSPSIYPAIYSKRFGDQLVIVIDIAEGGNKPYHFRDMRVNEGTYVRMGTHTMLATQDIIQQLHWQSQRKFLDEMPVYAAQEDDIDMSAFEKFLEQRKQHNIKADPQEMLRHYEILTKDRGRVYPTVAGILLFGKNPEKFFPEAFTICTHIAGTSGRDVIATRDSVGQLFQQYKDCVAFITSHLNASFTIKGTAAREEQLEIPPEAIREIVLNAIVHRNYLIPGPSKITLYDDRLEIFSPGNFPGPIKADKVDIGVTYIRNTIITRIFRDIGFIEKLGSGFITLFKSYAERKLPMPIITEGVGFVKCILPREPIGRKVENLEYSDFINTLLLTKKEIKVSDVMEYLKVSRSTAGRILMQLTQEGHLKKIGKGSATSYIKPEQ